jgi:hypothetical protein
MFATKKAGLRKALWYKNRNKSTDTAEAPPPSKTSPRQSTSFEPEISVEEPAGPLQSESLSISIEESPNDSTSCSSPSSNRVYRQHSCSATSIPEDEPLDNTNKSNRPPSRLSIKESLRSRIPPFLASRTRVKSANPVLGMPSVSLTSPTEDSGPKSPLSVSIDHCTCDIEAGMDSPNSPQQLLSTDYQPSSCKLHYSASERHHRSNSASPKNMYLKSSRSSGSNELLLSKRSPKFYLSMSDQPTVFDFEHLTTLDPRKCLLVVF